MCVVASREQRNVCAASATPCASRARPSVDNPGRRAQHPFRNTPAGSQPMLRHKLLLATALLAALACLTHSFSRRVIAQSTPSIALRGHVAAAGQRPMEGVIVTAKKTGSAMATSVVTDAAG